ncbi:putative oxidoreductase [Trypanosoma grayi]|uniref:putative oxidoreductase n=1 Tax=Trypanosoma grayi TaxID=71804 RepID=UPI0004F44221|nr:putative oxidoreductase [Trypanosoma grayi]KEG12052.1 putative oxidoreductase [Trypanosoma grayi]
MTSDPKTRLRVGILGAARVLRKSWVAIHAAGHEVTAVGSRDTARAQKLIDELCVSLSLTKRPLVGSYDDVVMASGIDVVYIPIPTAARQKWMLECAKRGKHVVGEKPAAESCQQLEEWLRLFSAKRLLFVDGTMLSHGNRVHDVRRAMQEIGKLRRMEAHFAFLASDDFLQNDIRLDPALEPMGALGDLGWYCVRYFLHMVDFTMPTTVMGRVAQRSGPKNGISDFSGELVFTVDGEPVVASFFCTFHAAQEQLVRIKCDNGIITVHGAINPTDEETPTFKIERNAFEWTDGVPSFHREVETRRCAENCTHQMVQLWRNVELALLRNDPEEPLVVVPDKSAEWARMAWVTQCVCDKLLESARNTADRALTAAAAMSNVDKESGPNNETFVPPPQAPSPALPVPPETKALTPAEGTKKMVISVVEV